MAKAKKTAATPRRSRSKSKPEEVEYVLSLSQDELTHLRDLLSISLPPEGEKTLSQSLSESNELDVDGSLWKKVGSACQEAGLELGDEAPDYVVMLSAPPALGVYRVIMEEEEEE